MSRPAPSLTEVDTERRENAVPIKPAGCPTAASLTRTFSSQDLFGDAKTVLIEHGGEQYRLILTKNGKLLLQK